MKASKLLVYDVGMNNGDDAEYYLKKGHSVIAIEANPELCAQARVRFDLAISERRIEIINVGVGAEHGSLPFYVHKTNSVLSTFAQRKDRLGYSATLSDDQFTTILVEVRKLSDVIRYFGPPHYIKIDIEGFDTICLEDLHMEKIFPQYISSEAHSVDTFCHLVAMGYEQFKIIRGQTVGIDFVNHQIYNTNGEVCEFSFKHHSAGPFGEDIPGDWTDKNSILRTWLERGDGWFDLHAKRLK